MYDPFTDYLGLSNLVAKSKMEKQPLAPICPPSSANTIATSTRYDFNSNGVDVTFDINNNLSTSPHMQLQPGQSQGGVGAFTPLTLESIAELSKVMRGKGGLRNRLGAGGSRQIVSWCVFCKNNGESELVYASHKLKSEDGATTCPILRAYTCPLCGVNGDGAHTIKYCPVNKDVAAAVGDGGNTAGTIGQGSAPAMGAQHYRTPRTSTGRRRTASLSGIGSIQPFASS